MAEPSFDSVDCISLPVSDLASALDFYRGELGHRLVWRTEGAAGLALGDGVTEIVLREQNRPQETDIKVESVAQAVERFRAAGGEVVAGPFDIAIGQCVVIRDPWGNQFVRLGFIYEGTRRQADKIGGEFVDMHYFGLLRGEWEARGEPDRIEEEVPCQPLTNSVS